MQTFLLNLEASFSNNRSTVRKADMKAVSDPFLSATFLVWFGQPFLVRHIFSHTFLAQYKVREVSNFDRKKM